MRLLGIDYGQKRIGVALGVGEAVSLFEVIAVNANLENALARLAFLCAQEKVDEVIVGLPLNELGEPTLQSLEVKDFARRLKAFVKVPIKFHDESFSTRQSSQLMTEVGEPHRSRGMLDSLCASLILRHYIEEKGKS